MTKTWLYAVAVVVLLGRPADADVWDIQDDNDDSIGTDNELLHGTTQTHDLGVRPGPLADEDWYLMPQKRQASYEVIIEGTSGDIGAGGVALERIASDGTTVLQTAGPAVTGSFVNRALRWANTTSSTVVNEFIRVSGGLCGTACGSDDVYTIRVHETTVNLARFNNSGGQTTIVLTQNACERPVNATFFYWNTAGTLLQTSSLAGHPSKALSVVNVATFPALVGQSGSVTVTHDGGYGALVIKAVAVEPATGFSFDTPGVYVPD
jgi:hypothetical protein